jgi:hypothetical protein
MQSGFTPSLMQHSWETAFAEDCCDESLPCPITPDIVRQCFRVFRAFRTNASVSRRSGYSHAGRFLGSEESSGQQYVVCQFFWHRGTRKSLFGFRNGSLSVNEE